MKKILGCVLALIMLTACSGGSSETKVCSAAVSGMDINATFTGNDEALEKVVMELNVPFALAGVTASQMEGITDEDLNTYGQYFLKNMGIVEGEGVEATFAIQDNAMVMTMNFDLSKGDTSSLTHFGLSADQSLSEAVEGLEATGATCK